jgi:hypothetical protein
MGRQLVSNSGIWLRTAFRYSGLEILTVLGQDIVQGQSVVVLGGYICQCCGVVKAY